MNAREFLEGFLTSRGRGGVVTGEPLYSYRCTRAEFQDAGDVVRSSLGSFGGLSAPKCQVFCLWAAEWWRRNHVGGPWRWEDMLVEVDAGHMGPGQTGYSDLQYIVGRGIQLWDRKLLVTAVGRAFLLTLACEGGLPIRMVESEGSHLRHFFKGLLDEVSTLGTAGVPMPDLAARMQHRLPASLRNNIVLELAGRLAETIWNLQSQLDDEGDPIAELDRRVPGWRDDLPLNLTDRTAAVFLGGLLKDAVEIRTKTVRLGWGRELHRVDEDWSISAGPELPSALPLSTFRVLFGQSDEERWPYFDLLVVVGEGTERPVATAQLQSRQDAADRYLLTEHRGTSRVSGSRAIDASVRFVARFQTASLELTTLAGAGSLSDLPWIFKWQEDGRRFAHVADGSCKLRDDSCLVLIPESWEMSVEDGAEPELLGKLRDRRIMLLHGTAVASHENDRVRVRLQAQDAAGQSSFVLTGRCRAFGRLRKTVFLGAPSVVELQEGGVPASVPSRELEWKSDLPGATWTRTSEPRGSGRVSQVIDGERRFSLRAAVVPPHAYVAYTPGTEDGRGSIAFRGFGADHVLVTTPDIVVETDRRDHGTVVLNVAVDEPVPLDLEVRLIWTDRGELDLTLPFPTESVGFFRVDGTELAMDDLCAVEDLPAVSAEARVLDGTNFMVEMDYRGAGGKVIRSSFRPPAVALQEVSPNQTVLEASSVRRLCIDVLEATDDPDATVRLSLVPEGRPLDMRGRIRVSRHGSELREESDTEPEALSMDTDVEEIDAVDRCIAWDMPPSGDVGPLHTGIEVRHVLNPLDDPRGLEVSAPGVWVIPKDLAPGPWMAVGVVDGQPATRPYWFNAAFPEGSWSDELDEVNTLEDAYASGNPTRAVRALLVRMSEDPSHEEWERFWHVVSWTVSFQPLDIPLLREVARNAEVAAAAAVFADSANFALLCDALDRLPFSWSFIPLDAWGAALSAHHDGLTKSLIDARFEEERAAKDASQLLTETQKRLSTRYPEISETLEFACRASLGRDLSAQCGALKTAGVIEVLRSRQIDLMKSMPSSLSRVDRLPPMSSVDAMKSGSWQWTEPFVLTLPMLVGGHDERFRVVNAPGYAAACVVSGATISYEMRVQLLALRDRAPAWFDDAYALALWIGLGSTQFEDPDVTE